MAGSFERGLFEVGQQQTVFSAEDAVRDIEIALSQEGRAPSEVRELIASQAFFNRIIEREEEDAA